MRYAGTGRYSIGVLYSGIISMLCLLSLWDGEEKVGCGLWDLVVFIRVLCGAKDSKG